MARFEYWSDVELTRPIVPKILGGLLFTGDSQGHLFGVRVTKDHEPVTLTGVVEGTLLRADGYTARCVGTISGNTASIVFDSDAYGAIGDSDVILRLTDGDVKTVLGVWHCYVSASETTIDYDPETPSALQVLLEQVEAKANQALAAATAASNDAASAVTTATGAQTTAGNAFTLATTASSAANSATAAAQQARTIADEKTTFYVQNTQPTNANSGDGWFDTAHDNKLYIYDGIIWNATPFGTAALAGLDAGLLTSGNLLATRIAQNSINGDKIVAHSLSADRIATGAITAESAIIATGAIKTANIDDLAVTDGKIQSLSASKLTAGTIDARDINVEYLNAANITVGTINGNQISDNAISTGKLASDVTSTLSGLQNGIDSNLTAIGNLASGLTSTNNRAVAAMDTADGKSTVYYAGTMTVPINNEANTLYFASEAPTGSDIETNDIWVNVDGNAGTLLYGAISLDRENARTTTVTIPTVSAGSHTFIVDITENTITPDTYKVFIEIRDASNNNLTRLEAAGGVTGKIIKTATTSADATKIYIYISSSATSGVVEINNIVVDPANQFKWNGSSWVADTSVYTLPEDAFKVDDIWFDVAHDNKPYHWNGNMWTEATFGDGAIAYLNAAKITTGYLAAGRIAAGTITADHIGSNAANLQLSSNTSVITNVQTNLNYAAANSPGGSATGVATGSSTLTATNFEVAFNGKAAMSISSTEAVFDVDTLSATGHIAGDIINCTTKALTIDASFDTLQNVINNLPKYLKHKVIINVSAGVYASVDICGFMGNGELGKASGEDGLQININGLCQGRIRILSCTCPIYIKGSGISSYNMINNAATTTILVYDSAYVWIQDIAMQGSTGRTSLTSGASDGIAAERGSFVRIKNCIIDYMRYAIFVNTCGRIFLEGCKGGLDSSVTTVASIQNRYGIRSQNGGMVFARSSESSTGAGDNTRPNGQSANSNAFGYASLGSSVATVSPFSGNTPVTPKQSYSFTTAGSYRAIWNGPLGSEAVVSGASWSKASPRKGKALNSEKTATLTNPYYYGLWHFTSTDLTAMRAVSNVTKITVTITRDNAMGAEGAVSTKLFYLNTAYTTSSGPTSTTKPNDILKDTGLSAKDIERGQSVVFELSSDMRSKVLDGTIKGFGVSANGNNSLAQFTTTGCVVTITGS